MARRSFLLSRPRCCCACCLKQWRINFTRSSCSLTLRSLLNLDLFIMIIIVQGLLLNEAPKWDRNLISGYITKGWDATKSDRGINYRLVPSYQYHVYHLLLLQNPECLCSKPTNQPTINIQPVLFETGGKALWFHFCAFCCNSHTTKQFTWPYYVYVVHISIMLLCISHACNLSGI